MSISAERDYSSRNASVSCSGSSSDLIDFAETDSLPVRSSMSRSRLGPVKTFSAALLEEFNSPGAPPKEERRKVLRSYRSEDVIGFNKNVGSGFTKSVSAEEVAFSRRRSVGSSKHSLPHRLPSSCGGSRRELPWSRSASTFLDYGDDLPPPAAMMGRSVSYHEQDPHRHRGGPAGYHYRRRTPPPIAPPRDIIVVVENLPDEYKPKDVRRLFLPFGNVDNKIRLSSGVARVTFTDVRSADECVKTLHGYPLSGKRLSLKFV